MVWVVFSVITHWQPLLLLVLFGGIVSAVTTKYSGDRGLTYQAIATFATIFGIIAGDGLVVYLLWEQFTNQAGLPDLTQLLMYTFQDDHSTVLFSIIGVIGGFWIWRG